MIIAQRILRQKATIQHWARRYYCPMQYSSEFLEIGVSLDTPLIEKIENEINMNDLTDQ